MTEDRCVTSQVPSAPLRTAIVKGLAVARRRPAAPVATVVIVHGAMDRAAGFSRVMRRLGEFDVVAYDRRGYAGSRSEVPDEGTRPDGTTPDSAPADPRGRDPLCNHARDLAAVVDWACAQDPALPRIVVGHSLGALIALVAAGTVCPRTSADKPGADSGPAPDTPLGVDALCLFEPPLPWIDPGYVTSGSRAVDIGRTDGPEAAAEFFYRSALGDRAWNRLSDSDRAVRRSEGVALVEELVAARAERPSLPLPTARGTVHVGRGDRGPVHLRLAAEHLARVAGVECTVIPGASHGAHLQHPDRFARWVREAALDAIGAGDRA